MDARSGSALLQHVEYSDEILDAKLAVVRKILPEQYKNYIVSSSLRTCLKQLLPYLGLFFKQSFNRFILHDNTRLRVFIDKKIFILSKKNFSLALFLLNLTWEFDPNYGFCFYTDPFCKPNPTTLTHWCKQNNLYFWSVKTHNTFSPKLHQQIIVILLSAQRRLVWLPKEIYETIFKNFFENYGSNRLIIHLEYL